MTSQIIPNKTQINKLTIQIEKDEDSYYVAEVKELPGCITQGKTIKELLERLKEAIELYLEEIQSKETKIELKDP